MMVNYWQPAVLLFYKVDNNADSVLPATSAGSQKDRGPEGQGGQGCREKIMELCGTLVDKKMYPKHCISLCVRSVVSATEDSV